MAEGGSVHIAGPNISQAVLTSGKPIRCYGYRFQSAASGPGTITFYDGTSASGTQRFQATGTANSNSSGTFGAGIKFTGGFFVTSDADIAYLEVDVLQEQST